VSAALFGRDTGSAEFVLSGLNRHLATIASDDFAERYQLHGSDIV
jgi:hypothetical protein